VSGLQAVIVGYEDLSEAYAERTTNRSAAVTEATSAEARVKEGQKDLRDGFELRRELGDRHGEANTRHALANIDFTQGEYEKARTEHLAVLELYRALGDRHSAATTLAAIASIDEAAQ
jgi:hypothetical protein